MNYILFPWFLSFSVVYMRLITSTALTAALGSDPKVCNRDIVETAANQGIMNYMYNCLHDANTRQGSQGCLAEFIAANAVENPFPITDGGCRDAYQTMFWRMVYDGSLGSSDECYGPELSEDDRVSFDCLTTGMILYMVDYFYDVTGFFADTFCSAAEVRARARARNENYFAAIVARIASTRNRVTLTDGPCDSCYTYDVFQKYIEELYDDESSYNYSSALEGCADPNGPTEICMQSTAMVNARRIFKACAGYDILFEGPMCSAEQVDMVEAMVPPPFFTIAHCAYKPQTPFCYAIGGYMDAIETATGTDCSACYSEFKSELAALALADIDEVCTGNVLADDCLVYLVDALTHFESCSGHTIGTAGPN